MVYGLCGQRSMGDDLHDVASVGIWTHQINLSLHPCTTGGDCETSIEHYLCQIALATFYTSCPRIGQTSFYAEAKHVSSTVAYRGGLPISAEHEYPPRQSRRAIDNDGAVS
jgi:hypothetical protein